MNSLKTFSEFRAEISIIEIATANGYSIDKSAGLKWPVLENEILGDKIIIVNAKNPANQGYWNVHDEKDKGTLITFIKNRLGSLFPYNNLQSDIRNVNAILYNYLNLPAPERNGLKRMAGRIAENQITKLFKLPETLRPLDNLQYLNKRGLNDDTIAAFRPTIKNLKSGSDEHSFDNIAFPYFDKEGNIIGLEIRNKQFKKMQSGSNRSVGVWYSSIPESGIENVILTESPIDALSYFQMKGEKYPVENTLYVAFGGTIGDGQLVTIQDILSESSNKNITFVSAVDNDEMGKSYYEKFKYTLGRVIEDFPVRKDYNEDLKASPAAYKVSYPIRR